MSFRIVALKSFVWSTVQAFGTTLLSFIVNIALARVLAPEEFGQVGLVTIFIGLGNVLLNAGLTTSLIRSDDVDEVDYSTVFYFNLAGSIVLYLLCFLIAPFFALFYKQPELTILVRIASLAFIINAFDAVQATRLTKSLNFRLQTLITLPATIVAAVISILMAYRGFGVWSLVVNSLLTSGLTCIILWVVSRWRPLRVFNIPKFKKHFKFGYKIMLSSVIDVLFLNLYTLLIGKLYSTRQLGYYTRADSFKQFPVGVFTNVVSRVSFPLFASLQHDITKLKEAYRNMLKTIIFLVAPILVFLAVLARPVFILLFTAKWLPAVPYFQILCVAGILYPIHVYNLNILTVMGRSDLFLKLEIVKKAIIILIALASIPFGIYGLIISSVISSILILFINAYYTSKLINYHIWHQLKDLKIIFVNSILSGILIYLFDSAFSSKIDALLLRLTCASLCGFGSYLALAYFFDPNFFSKLKLLINRK